MRPITVIAVSLILAPAVAHAQSSTQAQTQTKVSASAATKSASGEQTRSTDAQGSVEATLRAAHARGLPEEPIRRRVAEGRAKGASEAQIAAASHRTLVELQSSSEAMVRGGHAKPSDEETTRGAQLMERGYTSAQIEAVASKAPSDRSLVVAFETLTSLQARGASTATAVTKLEGLLAARASDEQLRELGASGNATAGLVGGLNAGQGNAGKGNNGTGNVAGSVAGTAGAAAGVGSAAAGATAGVTAGVTGAVGGVVGKKP
jgi:hypothetical protein